jgi:hypothetical protein
LTLTTTENGSDGNELAAASSFIEKNVGYIQGKKLGVGKDEHYSLMEKFGICP